MNDDTKAIPRPRIIPSLRDYARHDVLESVDGTGVAHLSHISTVGEYGSWYSLCGRVVPSWRRVSLHDTEHSSVCLTCERKATRVRSR